MTDTTMPQSEATSDGLSGSFIYESEHPQIPIPFTVRIGERRLEGKTLSITEAYASGLMPPNTKLDGVTMALHFDFEGFTLSLFVVGDVSKIGDSSSPDYKLSFRDPTASHLAPLRHILNSHLAGDLITMDRFLGYTGPTRAKSKAPSAPLTAGQRMSRFVKKTAIFGLSVGLIMIAASVVHNRVVFSYEPRPVLIGQSGDTLRATSAGQITYTNLSAGLGDVVYSIGANSGDLLSVRMPCDCEIQPLSDFYEGSTILAGTPLVSLVEADATPEADHSISFEGATRLIKGDAAELELSDGSIVPVSVNLTGTLNADQASQFVPAEISFEGEAADQVLVGETARLRFRREILPPFVSAQMNSAVTQITQLFGAN